MLLRKQSNLLN